MNFYSTLSFCLLLPPTAADSLRPFICNMHIDFDRDISDKFLAGPEHRGLEYLRCMFGFGCIAFDDDLVVDDIHELGGCRADVFMESRWRACLSRLPTAAGKLLPNDELLINETSCHLFSAQIVFNALLGGIGGASV